MTVWGGMAGLRRCASERQRCPPCQRQAPWADMLFLACPWCRPGHPPAAGPGSPAGHSAACGPGCGRPRRPQGERSAAIGAVARSSAGLRRRRKGTRCRFTLACELVGVKFKPHLPAINWGALTSVPARTLLCLAAAAEGVGRWARGGRCAAGALPHSGGDLRGKAAGWSFA